MPAQGRRDALKDLLRAVASSKPWSLLASSHLASRIRHSLSARIALVITVAALVILLVFGVIIASQLRTSMFETRKDAILADASLRFSSAQSVFSSSTASSPAQVQESARGALASLKASAAGAGATNVALLRSEGATASLRINQIEDEQMRALITPQMRTAVSGGGAQWQSVGIRSSDSDKVVPGILVGTQVQLPRAGTHELYILYSLSADQAQVDVVLRVLVLSALPIIVALPIGVFALLHRLLLPVRVTAQAATKASKGDLDVRVDVHGDDEMADLGHAFNAMTSSLQDTISRYDELAKLQQRFVSDVSHELRTPLVSIRGYSELYRQGALPTDEAVATAMSRIESESKRMGQLVEDLLTLARIDERRESKLAPFDLFNLAVDASNDAYATAPDRAVSLVGLNEEVAPTSATVLGDESRLRQVVANLLTNAMRYTPDGSPLEIAVGVREEVHGFPLSVLEVRDHGPGIHGEDRERVFERFYRTDASRSRETGGTGLGLSIVAAIIEQHEGRIHIEETDGGGATFVISLPFYPPPVSDDQLMK